MGVDCPFHLLNCSSQERERVLIEMKFLESDLIGQTCSISIYDIVFSVAPMMMILTPPMYWVNVLDLAVFGLGLRFL